MKVHVIGSGYVGLVSGACFASVGNEVVLVAIDKEKIRTLKEGKSPIFEPGLEEMLLANIDAGRLTFSTDTAASVAVADVVFLAVGTPSAEDGSVDLSALLFVCLSFCLLVCLSKIQNIMDKMKPYNFSKNVLHNVDSLDVL